MDTQDVFEKIRQAAVDPLGGAVAELGRITDETIGKRNQTKT